MVISTCRLLLWSAEAAANLSEPPKAFEMQGNRREVVAFCHGKHDYAATLTAWNHLQYICTCCLFAQGWDKRSADTHSFYYTIWKFKKSFYLEAHQVKSQLRQGHNKVLLPHSFLGSSDLSLQSLTESHTLELSMHSPFLHRNFRGPSHLVAATENQKVQSSIFTINFMKIHLHKLLHTDSQPRASQRVLLSNLKSPVVRQIIEGSHE